MQTARIKKTKVSLCPSMVSNSGSTLKGSHARAFRNMFRNGTLSSNYMYSSPLLLKHDSVSAAWYFMYER